MSNERSREDVDPYFFDPDGEMEARERLRDRYDHDDWEFFEQFRKDEDLEND